MTARGPSGLSIVSMLLTVIVVACASASIACHDPHKRADPGELTHVPLDDTASLGKRLFFETNLSGDRSVSCASCHRPAHAFADTSALSRGVGGHYGTRNTPSAMNLDEQPNFFWDGRARTLEAQALIPIANPIEMDLPVDSAVRRLQLDKKYLEAFRRLFHQDPDARTLALALAAFERTLQTVNTPFDDWRINNNDAALSESAKRGYTLFNTKAGCVRCHFGTNFNNAEFRNIGLYDGVTLKDSGRAAITHDPKDLGRFKIGPLRNIALTAPYMHNGMFKTLHAVIEYYNDPDKIVTHPVNRDSLLDKPLFLTDREMSDLEAFLRSLTDSRFASIQK